MRYSQLFGKTVKSDAGGSEMLSHQLLVRGGFIRESAAGRYFFLPLGWRVHEKIKAIIKEEMDGLGAQEMISPVLHPLELWQETNRTNTAGFELMKVTDRRGAEFALGGTAEEMFVDVVRKFQLSYRDLPFNVYQFSTKFRDELRARGGLLRVREFVMKDAYSFDVDEGAFRDIYEAMAVAYARIFEKMGLKTYMVEADNGYIGGEYCHEFVVEHEAGESTFFVTEDGTYVAHEDVAVFESSEKNLNDELQDYVEVEAVRGRTMEDGQKLHGMPMWQQLKDVMFVDRKGEFFLTLIRGDMDVNKTKLEHLVDRVGQLETATDEQVRGLGSEPGFISPVGLADKVTIVADKSLRTVRNMYGGANKLNRDAMNLNYGRDFEARMEGDIGMAKEGCVTRDGKKLIQKKGIEVGNIFQLGLHYSKLMERAVFVDSDGKSKPYYMGSYGIGLGRTMATIVEKFSDERGIVWPEILAPYRVHLVSLGNLESGIMSLSEDLYNRLIQKGVEVLWDDRDESPGKKLADADLIGCPVRLVVSARNEGKVEWKRRESKEVEMLEVGEVVERL